MLHVCERCDRPATNHEVEVVDGRKAPHHLCDEHAKERARELRSDPERLYCGTLKLSWAEWLERQWAPFRDRPGVEWPVCIRIPARMTPGPPPCSVCGEKATDRDFEFAEDGTLLRDEARCVAHGGRPIEATVRSVSKTINGWPPTCERCDAISTIHVNTVEDGRRTTHHFCTEHAEEEGIHRRHVI